MTYYTYILYSHSLDRYYVGHTSNVDERVKKHLQHHRGFTAKAKDWIVVYTEEFASKVEAYARERQIKKWKSRIKIEELFKES